MPARRSPSSPSPALWRWAAAGLSLGGLASCLVFAPARWLADAAQSLSNGRVQLQASSGTVWDGEARLLLTGGDGSKSVASLPGRLHWTSRVRWGSLELDINAPCCTRSALQLQITPALTGWTLQAQPHQSDWPAELLSGLGTPWNTVLPEGMLHLGTPGMTLKLQANQWSMDGSMTMEAQLLASRLSTLHPLGHYRLALRGGATPELTLSTLEGALQLQGQGQWAAGQWRFQGQAEAAPEHAAELENLLNILGRRQGARSLITLG